MTDDSRFDAFTASYNTLINTVAKLDDLKDEIESNFNPENDRFFSNPLEYGPRNDVKSTIHNCKEDFIKFIVRQITKEDIYKNLVVDEDAILKQFGIGYITSNRYGSGFDARDVIHSFNELYPPNEIESVIYDQILDNSKKSLPWSGPHKVTDIKRFGKDNCGVILSYCTSNYYGHNSNYTSTLLKLIEISLVPVKPSNAAHIEVEPGETYSSLSYKSLRAYKNGNLKIVFNFEEDADTICGLLLQEDEKDVS